MANIDIEARKQELLKEGYTEVYTKTKVLTDAVMHYCPGCGHGTTHRLIAGQDRRRQPRRLLRAGL